MKAIYRLTRKTPSKIFALATVVALAAALTIAWNATRAWADGDDQARAATTVVNAGLNSGETLRTIMVNTGPRAISVQISGVDIDAGTVQHSTLVLQPGQIRTFEATRSPGFGSEEALSTQAVHADGIIENLTSQLLTGVTVRQADLPNLQVAAQVVNPGPISRPLEGIHLNHNETLLSDTAPVE
jgi:hypothetical protein